MDYNKSNKAVKALQVAAAFAYLSVVMMDKVSIYYIKDDYVYDLALNIANKDQFFNNIQKLNEIDLMVISILVKQSYQLMLAMEMVFQL